jgi:hypothetical protein
VIERADALLRRWIRSVVGEELAIASSLPRAAPSPGESPRGVAFELLDIAPAPMPHAGARRPLACQIRYLVSAWAESLDQGHEILGGLLAAAMDDERRTVDLPVEADLTPVPPETWLALQAVLRAAFVVRVPLTVERPVKAAPRVTESTVRMLPTTSLEGRLVGPRDIPLPGASVVLMATGQTTETDRQGRFRFSMVPGGSSSHKLEVTAKGDTQRFEIKDNDNGGEPMLLRFQIQEG